MKKVFVSGCYDILHAGHLQFFEEARALGDYLIVSFASAEEEVFKFIAFAISRLERFQHQRRPIDSLC